MSAREACRLIRDGGTLLLTGSGGGIMDAEHCYAALEECFLETGRPRELCLVHITGIGDGASKGLNHFAHDGMVRRVIGGHWGWSPTLVRMAQEEKIEAYNLPQGVLSLLTREIAGGRSGLVTTVGLNTFIDPRLEGGRLNRSAAEGLVELIQLDGQDRLFYRSFPIDAVILRGTTADEEGSITVEQEAANLDILSAALAAHNSGGKVIAQVKRLAARGSLPARMVKVPGFLVDAVVVDPGQWQTYEGEYNPSFSGELRTPLGAIDPLPLDVRTIVARRAALELGPGNVVNLGFGIADGIANVVAEEGLSERLVFTIEQGVVGGVPAKGAIFGAGFNPQAIVDAPYQFDFYHGGGLDMAFLGMAQVDASGNVNVSRFGDRMPGCGGFIDISQNARTMVFCGTFTAGGLQVEIRDGRLSILREGRSRKLVSRVQQVTFSGEYARRLGHRVLYVTERAVFRLGAEALELIEVAPGIDPERQVAAQMEFEPAVSPDLAAMDPRIFAEGPMRLDREERWSEGRVGTRQDP